MNANQLVLFHPQTFHILLEVLYVGRKIVILLKKLLFTQLLTVQSFFKITDGRGEVLLFLFQFFSM
jgi:hypothetical protein